MNRISRNILAVAMLPMVLASSCRDDDLLDRAPSLSDDAIRIGAQVDQLVSTRTYIENGAVNSGKFLLTYPYYYNGADAFGMYRYLYHYGDVTFGYQGQETTGFVNVGTATAPKELVWSPTNTGTSSDDGIFVYPSTRPSPLILDNFMYRANLSNGQADTVVNLADYPLNPFKAGIFDSKGGSNDLLWGKELVPGGTQQIEFKLGHRMTRLKLNVIVEPNNSDDDTQELTINLDNALVTLTKVLLNPVSYRRLYGELLFQERSGNATVSPEINPELYQDFTLVNPALEEDENENKYEWVSKTLDESTGNITYATQDFVFVPQTLKQGTSERPQIVIAIPKDDVNDGFNPGYEDQNYIYFKGNLPVTMYMDHEDGTPSSLQTLNFDPGKVITLTIKMKPGSMDLEFAPVTVEPWVYKGTFYPTAQQSGIYTARDLYTLIEYYNEGNDYWLRKFGYMQPNGRWMFMINSGSLEFEAAKIIGKMIPGQVIEGSDQVAETPAFDFNFRSREEFYLMPDGTKVTMGILERNLYDIVTTPGNTGVKRTGTGATETNFPALIQAYQKNFWQQLIYGNYSTDDSEWTFKVAEDVTLDYKAIVATMIPPKTGNQNFRFSYEPGVTVTVTNYPGASGPVTADTDMLYSIVSERVAGIYSGQEFYLMLAALKAGDTPNLQLYGTLEGGQWTFPLQRNVTITAENIQGALYGATVPGYQIDNNGYTLTFTQYQGANVVPTLANLQTIMGLRKPTGLQNADDFYSLTEAYGADSPSLDALSRYGYYNFAPNRWVFFFTEGMTLDKERIQGTMIPGGFKLPFVFNLNYKQLKFEGEAGDGVTGQQGADKLLEIVSTPAETPAPDEP